MFFPKFAPTSWSWRCWWWRWRWFSICRALRPPMQKLYSRRILGQPLLGSMRLCGLQYDGQPLMVISWCKRTELALSFLFSSCVCFCLYGPFYCILVHKLSRQLSAFSLCSSSPISAVLVFSAILSHFESLNTNKLLQPWYNRLWLTWLTALTN